MYSGCWDTNNILGPLGLEKKRSLDLVSSSCSLSTNAQVYICLCSNEKKLLHICNKNDIVATTRHKVQ